MCKMVDALYERNIIIHIKLENIFIQKITTLNIIITFFFWVIKDYGIIRKETVWMIFGICYRKE
jgi:hypothetical protein